MRFPERRRHVRVVTLRNFGYLSIALLIVFAVVTVRSEMRGRHMNEYGRLLDRQLEREVPQQKPVEVVQESATEPAPVPAPAPAQPMYIEETGQTIDASTVTPILTTVQQPMPARSRDSRVAIVGGPEGVAIVQQTERRPVLSGGFGRP